MIARDKMLTVLRGEVTNKGAVANVSITATLKHAGTLLGLHVCLNIQEGWHSSCHVIAFGSQPAFPKQHCRNCM